MPVEVWQQFMAFPQFTLGIASYSLLWNMSPAFAERAREQDAQAANDPIEQPGTHEILAQDAEYFETLPKYLGFSTSIPNPSDGNSLSIPQSMEECNDFVLRRLTEVGIAWEREVPWLSHQCRLFRDILMLPRLEREQALLSLDRLLKFRFMGLVMLIGGNGMFASLHFPSPERILGDPNASELPIDFFEDRNTRIREHFQARDRWISTYRSD